MGRVFGLGATFLQSSNDLSQVVLLSIHNLSVLIESKEILVICPTTAAFTICLPRPWQPALGLPQGILDSDVNPVDLAELSTLVIIGHSEALSVQSFR